MKKVITLAETAELELLKNVLDEAGIRCVLKNAQLAQALPIMPFETELWVLKDEDMPQALALCQDWFHPKPGDSGLWECPKCGLWLGSRFDHCWRCSTPRDLARALIAKGIVL